MEPAKRSENAPARRAVAIVDDEPTSRYLLRAWIQDLGYAVREYSSAGALLADGVGDCAAICVDLGLDDMPGMDLVGHLHAAHSGIPIVVVTARTDAETVVTAMHTGAEDYVTKPLDRTRVSHAVERAVERADLVRRVHSLESTIEEQVLSTSLVGTSPAMQELRRQIHRVVDSDVVVCVFGESGTGKEIVARALHDGGPRRAGPFVALNCAAIPESLQESELFGHERGAFTGAQQSRKGRFEQANGGTIFLDELGEMSPATQASLLRTIQERTIRRVGGSSDIPITARIVCATHRDLRAEVAAGRFREDLYFRLVVYPIRVPPLRERLSDLPLLVGHFLSKLEPSGVRRAHRVSADALDALTRHAWPGNVRELQNVMHRGILSAEGDEIGLSDLPIELRRAGLPPLPLRERPLSRRPSSGSIMPLRDMEALAIERALEKAHGSVAGAAKLLGVGRATLYRRLATGRSKPA